MSVTIPARESIFRNQQARAIHKFIIALLEGQNGNEVAAQVAINEFGHAAVNDYGANCEIDPQANDVLPTAGVWPGFSALIKCYPDRSWLMLPHHEHAENSHAHARYNLHFSETSRSHKRSALVT